MSIFNEEIWTILPIFTKQSIRKKSFFYYGRSSLRYPLIASQPPCGGASMPAYVPLGKSFMARGNPDENRQAALLCNIKFSAQIKKAPAKTGVLERQKGVEPSSPAWKAGVMSRYTTAALCLLLYRTAKKVSRAFMKNFHFF